MSYFDPPLLTHRVKLTHPLSIHHLILKRDVTLEKEYRARYYQAEKIATIGLLAAGVGHEINNPLTAICGFAEGLERRLSKVNARLGQTDTDQQLIEDFEEYVKTIRKECGRCRTNLQMHRCLLRPTMFRSSHFCLWPSWKKPTF